MRRGREGEERGRESESESESEREERERKRWRQGRRKMEERGKEGGLMIVPYMCLKY